LSIQSLQHAADGVADVLAARADRTARNLHAEIDGR